MVFTAQNGIHKIKMIALYGLHTIINRKRLWFGLLGPVQFQGPMIVIGDDNAGLLHRANGIVVTDAETVDFEDFLLSSSSIEARSIGLFYSWSNSSEAATSVQIW